MGASTKIFSANSKMAGLILYDYHLLPVINRFGIRLGFKDKTIDAVCLEHGLNTEFFLTIVNTYSNERIDIEEGLLSFSPLLIVNYLKKTHAYYLEVVIPKMDALLHKITESNAEKKDELQLIKRFYLQYKEELIRHIEDEEENVFPYVIKLLENPEFVPGYSVMSYEEEHTDVDEKLNDLRNLIIKYIEPIYDVNYCNEFLITLFRFERDLQNHARIEDKVLIPQVVLIEKERAKK